MTTRNYNTETKYEQKLNVNTKTKLCYAMDRGRKSDRVWS